MKLLRPDRLSRLPRDDKAIEESIAKGKPDGLVRYFLRLLSGLKAMYTDIATAFSRTEDVVKVVVDDEGTFFEPPRISQNDEPTLSNNGEMIIWHDADGTAVYLVYKDATEGQKKVQLT